LRKGPIFSFAGSRGIATIEILLDFRHEAMKKLFSHLGYPARYESYVLDIADHMEIDITKEKNLMAPHEEVLIEFRL
jgi:hypothetical protein